MSYARFGWDGSDVYVFMCVSGKLECCGCILQEREWVDDPGYPIFGGYLREVGEIVEHRFDSTQGMVDHLALHRATGHAVPDCVEPALRTDDAENFGGAS
jgi:hypothetical protein